MNYNRTVLTSLNINTLDADDLDLCVFEQIAEKKNLTHKDEYGIINRMDDIEKALLGTHILEAEVYNGGFNQFFFNYGGYFVQEAHDGCILMGADEHKELLEQAVEIYNIEGETFDKAFEIGSKEGFVHLSNKKLFDHLDSKFFSLPRLAEFRIELIKQHKNKFIED